MKQWSGTISALVAAVLSVGCATDKAGVSTQSGQSTAVSVPQTSDVRIGVYDSRAIAIAWARSGQHAKVFNAVMGEQKEAAAGGDAARAEQLRKQLELRQLRLHLQGFSNAPVNDALDAVRSQLPEVMARRGVVALAATVDCAPSGVTTVDLTNDIVLLFGPDAATLRMLADLRDTPPLPIEQVAAMPIIK